MSNIIHLLPDAVANQIAAGEVIQRPASVVKELVENAIDAGADTITIHIKDAGRTLIQVVDNGKGMTPADARMSFERHATSKIREANDLFSIRSLGFRGEALASIASVADVELRTRQHGDELGTFIHILGSAVQKQVAEMCQEGSNFAIKNLFFNVPARRKFLKSNSYELKNIITEVQRIALVNPELSISLFHNQSPVYELMPENIRRRIAGIFGKGINQSLTPVDVETSLIKISGFIGQPKFARKSFGEQFFFVNGRFMKHPFFHRAVSHAYDKILPPDTIPSYFLYFEVDPATIDINIHPTKTEIKFEDEQAIWHILNACIREAIGKFNLMPAIDFDQSGSIDIPLPPERGSMIAPPGIEIDPHYNPFRSSQSAPSWRSNTPEVPSDWAKLYSGLENQRTENHPSQQTFHNFSEHRHAAPESTESAIAAEEQGQDGFQQNSFLQLKNRYLLTPVKSGLMVIDQREAHARILFDNFMQNFQSHLAASQRQLFPPMLQLEAGDAEILNALRSELYEIGFEIRPEADGVFYIDGAPAVLSHMDARELIEHVIAAFQDHPVDLMEEIKMQLATVLAQASAINRGAALRQEEIVNLFNQLFACKTPGYSPTGKKIISIISMEDFAGLMR